MEQLIETLQNPAWRLPMLIGLAVLAVAIIAWLWWRRRGKAGGQLDETEQRWELINAYGQVFPSFLFILNCYRQKHEAERLFDKPDVAAALDQLKAFYDSSNAKNRKSPSILLFPVPATRSSQVKAALLTVLRGIFDDEELSQDLPPQAQHELDSFLDSLTE